MTLNITNPSQYGEGFIFFIVIASKVKQSQNPMKYLFPFDHFGKL